MTDVQQPHSQTLSRGLRVLEVLADSAEPMTIADLAATLGVHRSIAYRILRTLEDHGMISRNAAGAFALAPKMAALARGVERSLQAAALPELTTLANELTMTAFLVVLDHTQCVTLSSVEPRAGTATVAQRPGTRHSLALGAPGIAIQSLLTDRELAERGVTRRPLDHGGFATSHDEVIPGLRSVAVPLSAHGSPPAALAAVYVSSDRDASEIATLLLTASRSIGGRLG
ncbi:IclR family transcriptional regulator [Diaminobutyricibacter sp. McL0608]|uniref:IclR family transcriptional regulator n=1 Tax=Leifsonia sp. McL0608 TaxID=3143537 RepID=UPI0031F2EE4D